MGEQSENSVVLKSIRRDVTEDLKNMSLDSLNIDGEDIAVLKSMGISTLGDLLGASTTQLYDRLKTGILSRYWGIRNTVMDMGLLFTDDHAEYEELGINNPYKNKVAMDKEKCEELHNYFLSIYNKKKDNQ